MGIPFSVVKNLPEILKDFWDSHFGYFYTKLICEMYNIFELIKFELLQRVVTPKQCYNICQNQH